MRYLHQSETLMIQTTLSIIKPDGTQRNLIGKIVARFEEEGLEVAAMQMRHLSRREAEGFYAEHKARSFFDELVTYMISAPVVVMALRGENAVDHNRQLMGATNPKEAAEGTIRKLFGQDIGMNTVHGSDSPAAAEREVGYFFPKTAIF